MRLLFLLLISFGLEAQTLDGIMNIKFGSSIDSVKKVMLLKTGCKLDIKNSDSDRLIFDGVKFAGRETLFMNFQFIDKKLHTAVVVINPNLESQAVDLYTEIQNEINSKYYISTDEFETYKTPYEKGDGYTESAIKLGKASFTTYWKFKNAKSAESPNYIALEITESLNIKLAYQDGYLVELASKKENKKKSQDY